MKTDSTPRHPSIDVHLGPSSLVDTHCHLDMEAYHNDLDEVLERAFAVPLSRIVSIGINVTSSAKCIELARRNNRVAATIGIHPHDVDSLTDQDYRALERLYRDNIAYVHAVGEIGLDYYRHYATTTNQKRHFRRQLDMAHDWGLPVVIHNRDADDDLLEILSHAKSLDHGGVMHCFSGDMGLAAKVLDLGLKISLTGVITFKKSERLQEVARTIPLTAMVLETDGPFLAPQPFRGKRNEPAMVALVAKKIADLRHMDIAEVARQTTQNAETLFRFDKS
jgi:TatD DNase family protein